MLLLTPGNSFGSKLSRMMSASSRIGRLERTNGDLVSVLPSWHHRRKWPHSLLVSVPWCATMISPRTGSNPTYPANRTFLSVSKCDHDCRKDCVEQRTELGDGAIAARRDGLERRVRWAVRSARPRPRHVRRAERGARVVRVRPERGDLRRRERRYRRRALPPSERRGDGDGGDGEERPPSGEEERCGAEGLEREHHCRSNRVRKAREEGRTEVRGGRGRPGGCCCCCEREPRRSGPSIEESG